MNVAVQDFLRRIALRDECQDPVVPLPEGKESLRKLHARLQNWFDKGWSLQVGVAQLNAEEFLDYTVFRITQDVANDVRKTIDGINETLQELFGS